MPIVGGDITAPELITCGIDRIDRRKFGGCGGGERWLKDTILVPFVGISDRITIRISGWYGNRTGYLNSGEM